MISRLIFLLNTYLIGFISVSQDVSVSIKPDKLSIGNTLQISITINNDQIRSYGKFPEIEGFKMRGISSSSSTNFINGKRSSSQSIIQNYLATNSGTYEIPDFKIERLPIKYDSREV